MTRLPKILVELSLIEKLNIKEYKLLNDQRTIMEVTATDGREYFVFGNKAIAQSFAAEMYAKYEDDPDVFEDLELLGKPMSIYSKEYVDDKGVSYVLSYDQHHHVKLNGKAIAYRNK